MQSTNQIAIFDTDAGFLQWIGQAHSADEAVRALLDAVGYTSDAEYEFRIIDVTDQQADALRAWADAGSKSPDYPDDLDDGIVFGSAEVAEIATRGSK